MESHHILTSVAFVKQHPTPHWGLNLHLVRTSAAPSSKRSNVNFVSVDLLNEYLASLFGNSQDGKSIDAFVNNKNALNCDEIGEVGMISTTLFLKLFKFTFTQQITTLKMHLDAISALGN